MWEPFSDFLASVPNKAIIRLAPGARYRMEQTLVIDNRHDLTIDGRGATIFATTPGTRGRSHVKVVNSTKIGINNLKVSGAHPNGGTRGDYVVDKEAQHGFEAKSVAGFALAGVTVTDVYGDFVYLGKEEDGPWTSDVWILNSQFARNGRIGVGMTAVRNVLIENNSFDQIRRSTFDLEAHSQGFGFEQVTIRNNDIGSGRLLLIASVGIGPRDDFTFEGNRVERTLDIVMSSTDGEVHRNWKIINNTSTTVAGNPHRAAMVLDHIDGLEIRGNRQQFEARRQMVGARVTDSCRVDFDGNTYPGAVAQGVLLGSSTC